MNNIERKYFKPLIPMAKIHLGQFLNRNYLVNSNHCRPHAMELNEKFEFAKKSCGSIQTIKPVWSKNQK